MAVSTTEIVGALQKSFSGTILTPGTDDYEEVRLVHNGLVDKRPAIIARCRTSEDVSVAIGLARDAGLEISVRGGGHNVTGKAVTEGGLMIDLSLMKAISVDADAKTITAQGGVTWGELNDAAHARGLATTGGVVSTTGIGGLTLGAGLGWTMAAWGMAVDNLLSAEIVLANGDVVTASEDADADLFWAIRGGGGNFGVATSLTYRAYALDTVLGGPIVHMPEAAPAVLRLLRDFVRTMPDELTVFGAFRHAPDGSGARLFATPVCHIGEPSAAERDLKPLREFGPPVMDMVERMPYPVINTQLDDGFPKGRSYYWKSAFFSELSDDAIDLLPEIFGRTPNDMCFLVLESFTGAGTRVDPTAMAFPHRAPGFNLILISGWDDPSQADACIGWTRGSFDVLRAFMADRVYVNYMDADDTERVKAAYGPNYERVVSLKRRYDPDNLFHLNQNIKP